MNDFQAHGSTFRASKVEALSTRQAALQGLGHKRKMVV